MTHDCKSAVNGKTPSVSLLRQPVWIGTFLFYGLLIGVVVGIEASSSANSGLESLWRPFSGFLVAVGVWAVLAALHLLKK